MNPVHGLTELEQNVLGIEHQVWRYTGTKERAVRARLDMSMTRFYQTLNAMLGDPRVEAADPLTVRRLRRVRDARAGARAVGRRGGSDDRLVP